MTTFRALTAHCIQQRTGRVVRPDLERMTVDKAKRLRRKPPAILDALDDDCNDDGYPTDHDYIPIDRDSGLDDETRDNVLAFYACTIRR